MKTLFRALVILVLSFVLGFGLYSAATPLSSAASTTQAGNFHGNPAYAGQAGGGGERSHGAEGGAGSLASLLPALGEFGASFLAVVALMAALGKLGKGQARPQALGLLRAKGEGNSRGLQGPSL